MMKVKYGPHIANVYADFHMHTLFSGHAMASPEEMVKAAKSLGLDYIALTDHVYEYTERHDIENQRVRAAFFTQYLATDEIKVIGGREMNIFTDNRVRFSPGLNLCAWHSWFGPATFTVDDALLSHEALARNTHIMCHPERTAYLFEDKDAMKFINGVLKIMSETAVKENRRGYIEVNTTSACDRFYTAPVVKRMRELQQYMLDVLAKEYPDLYITVGSDAHCTKDIGYDFSKYLNLIDAYGLINRVVNLNTELCDELIEVTKLSL